MLNPIVARSTREKAEGRVDQNMGLKTLIVRRIILAVPVAIGVVTIIFAALSVMTPVMRIAYFAGSSPRDFSRENIQRLVHAYGLDQPILVQYTNWLKQVAVLDFGRSLSSGAPAMSAVLASLPTTLELLLYSVPFIVSFSIWVGSKAAINHNKPVDHAARIVGILGTSVPVFVTAAVLIMICLVVQNPYRLRLNPYMQLSYDMGNDLNLRIEQGNFTQYTKMISIDALLNGDTVLFENAIEHLVLPIAVLVFTQCAALIRVTRSGLIEELGKPYTVTAMSKGLSRKEATYKHARKNASISVLTVTGLLFSNMFVSLVIVERVFDRPGFASLLASSARTMDTPVLFACTILVALFLVLVNIVVDILYQYIDPRIKL